MKRIRCPKCDEAIRFDETLYEPGRILVFQCPACQKQFRLRLPAAAPSESADQPLGQLTVLENDFQLKTVIPLHEGDNVIGRHVRGTRANAAFKTVDPSIDTTHCIVSCTLQGGTPHFTLRDAPSGTGTFLQGELLADRERAPLHDGDIINIGAATLIANLPGDKA